ncbi:MAG: GDSL-type esterase/lipase family protein [Bacillaceae bacterium]|nr:GDSL-type esterase/lipase family protein [Bacillaceae bacterium]
MVYRPILFTALGDSLTSGVGSLLSNGFVEEYALLTERTLRRNVVIHNYAKSGIKSDQLIHDLRRPEVRNSIFYADIITITIGGNDLLHANREFKRTGNPAIFSNALHYFRQNVSQVLNEIDLIKANNPSPYTLRVIGLYNPYPSVPYSHYWVDMFNKTLADITNQYGVFVNIYPTLTNNKKMIWLDKLHPNKNGYKTIAYELYKTGYNL